MRFPTSWANGRRKKKATSTSEATTQQQECLPSAMACIVYSQENSDSERPSLCAFTLHVSECIGHKPYPFVTSSLGLIATSLTTLLAPPPRGLAASPTFEVSGYTPVGDDEQVSLCRVQLCHVPIGIISLGYLCTHR
jgi:hypothetical protein